MFIDKGEIMDIEVRVERNSYYGKRIYPMCDNAKRFAEIADTKTLTERVCKVIEGLGVTITVIPEKLNLCA
jgi:hypothetical protein